jgi:ESCRT-II complex subunit VPS25
MQEKPLIDTNVVKFMQKPYFYTLQDHLQTRRKQISMWANITLTYFNKKQIHEFSRSQLESPSFLLYNNTNINRRLNKSFINQILGELEAIKKIEFKDNNKDTFFIYHTSVDDLAESIYKWSKNMGKIGRVETIQFLASDEEVQGENFWGQPEETIIKACKILQQKGKLELFDLGGEENPNMMGVKFK